LNPPRWAFGNAPNYRPKRLSVHERRCMAASISGAGMPFKAAKRYPLARTSSARDRLIENWEKSARLAIPQKPLSGVKWKFQGWRTYARAAGWSSPDVKTNQVNRLCKQFIYDRPRVSDIQVIYFSDSELILDRHGQKSCAT
jgi:hypothetical protein